MITQDIFEIWNIDTDLITDEVIRLVGPCDIFLGGSLADDLGTMKSDIDVYCFREDGNTTTTFPVISRVGDVILEIYTVNVNAEFSEYESLKPLIVEDVPPAPQRWPLLSPQRFRQMHALYRNRGLKEGKCSDFARHILAADLLHIYVALRAMLSVGTLTEDLSTLTDPENAAARLYCARMIVENSIDAALATRELVNPNPKWRLRLARKARFIDSQFPDSEFLLSGLFPAAGDIERAVGMCLQVSDKCLDMVRGDGILTRFEAVMVAADLLHSAAGDAKGNYFQ